ncbi:thioredoxin family protein [Rivularia sp. UHCC 0363]|uniref:thioredoxin family protein n=1 Tax=Rivularia sp. UHCC 0363 TaxID=3110244 RepID=UPI002B1F6389|nr:thioredoxin family protein [Rivularia sp. UHCC 0363]MEA5597075.1 thioredoxin family protein [Rivularia sp. UHCC 0363]
MVLSVSERTFTKEVLESQVPVLVNFGAPWCGLCRVIKPLLLQFKSQCGEELKLVEVNADDNFKLSTTYRLKTLPTLLLIQNGIVGKRLEGFRGREEFFADLSEIKDSCTNSSRTYNSVDRRLKATSL